MYAQTWNHGALMLRVSIHAGLSNGFRFNLVAWADIAYEKLAPIATTRRAFRSRIGGTLPIPAGRLRAGRQACGTWLPAPRARVEPRSGQSSRAVTEVISATIHPFAIGRAR